MIEFVLMYYVINWLLIIDYWAGPEFSFYLEFLMSRLNWIQFHMWKWIRFGPFRLTWVRIQRKRGADFWTGSAEQEGRGRELSGTEGSGRKNHDKETQELQCEEKLKCEQNRTQKLNQPQADLLLWRTFLVSWWGSAASRLKNRLFKSRVA